MFWSIDSFPATTHHVFLSHSQEDFESLVDPVYKSLIRRQIRPWLAGEDWYYGRDSRSSMRDGILRSRHTVFFITDALLKSPRGWCVLELAYSEILQSNLMRPGGTLLNVALPLCFTKKSSGRFKRSVWQTSMDRAHFFEGTNPIQRIAWASSQIKAFLLREESLAFEMAQNATKSQIFRNGLDTVHGRMARVTRFYPTRTNP